MNTAELFQAVKSGDLAEVQRILKHNPNIDVDALNDGGYTPFLRAIACSHIPIVEILLAHGAAVNGPVGALRTPLQRACLTEVRSDIVSLLLEHGADVDATTARERKTPLTLACDSNNISLAIIQLLTDAGADVNGGGGWIPPLHDAASSGNKKAMELLIQSGADVNRVSTGECGRSLPAGSTPLHFAAHKKGLSCLKKLLEAGADPNIANSAGQTPLHRGAVFRSSSVEIITTLLGAGCDPLHQDNDGRTPLQYLYYETRYSYFFSREFNTITALVAAGDRSWECVPTPCPGLEAAMLSVWQNAPDELPELVKRLENPPQTLIELYARMDDDEEMKKVVQEVLRVLHHHFSGFPHLKEHLLSSIFGLGTVS